LQVCVGNLPIFRCASLCPPGTLPDARINGAVVRESSVCPLSRERVLSTQTLWSRTFCVFWRHRHDKAGFMKLPDRIGMIMLPFFVEAVAGPKCARKCDFGSHFSSVAVNQRIAWHSVS
jgi:hypothetical protein